MKINTFTMVFLMATVTLLLSNSCKNLSRHDDTSGTIGQVKKYRKEQMSEKDILLRSEVMKDTSRLDEIIQGLIFFNAYTTTLEISLGNRLVDMESVSGFSETYNRFIHELSDFRDFLENNNSVLTNTITMLVDFYNDTITESSADVENNLRAFVKYIRQLEEKDSVLTVMVNNLDDFIEDKEQAIIDKEEVEKLKAIRDELILRILQGAFVLDDPEAIAAISEKNLYSLSNVDQFIDIDQLQETVTGIFVGTIGYYPVVIESFFTGSGDLSASAAGGISGSGSLPPAIPPGSPNFAPEVPVVVQGLIIADKDILGFVQIQESRTDLNASDFQSGVATDTPLPNLPDYYGSVWITIGFVADFVQSVEGLDIIIDD